MEKKTEEETLILNCTICGLNFEKRYKLNIHLKDVHKEKLLKKHKNNFNSEKCHTCKKSFSGKHQVTRHIKLVHEKVRPYKCTICKKGFSEKPGLVRHFEEYHKEEKTFQCDKCEKVFGGVAALKEHLKFVHTTILHKCNLCGTSFKRVGHLNYHIN